MRVSACFVVLIIVILTLSSVAFQSVTSIGNSHRFCPANDNLQRKSTSTQLDMKKLLPKNNNSNDAPPLKRHPPRKVCLMVEPTPFTHVSGYANRFKEMLKFMSKAGDKVDILTVDSKTPADQLPKSAFGYPIQHTLGFTFPLYNQISLTLDLPEMKGAAMLEKFKPDLIHVTSP
jgi:sulfoquinovosyltransferase